MLRKILMTGLTASALVFSTSVFAGDQSYRSHKTNYRISDYAEVVEVEPIVRYVRVKTPHRECWDEVQYYSDNRYRHRRTAGATIVGGVIGGVLGNQFGDGRGKDAATLAGLLIGSAIGHDRASRRAGNDYAPEYARNVERCNVSYSYEEEERIDGYRVTYLYGGEYFTTRMREHPGHRVRVRVAVTPVGT